MKIYLDSLDDCYFIEHKNQAKEDKNNERIGIIAYIAFLISGWLK
jgi:hypothetical protein